jgi:GT2 family glycosyltransferase
VSVVIPTYNRCGRLEQVLRAVAAQTYPRHLYEVVVISDGSTDDTDAYMRDRPPTDVTFIEQSNAGPAAARNRGVEAAAGTLLLFVDDDVIASPQLVERHVAHQRGADDLVVVGPMLTPDGVELHPWVAWEQAMLYRQYDAMLAGEYDATPRQFYTGNASVARDQVLAVGGFDPRFRRAEDIELAYRLEAAGCRFRFDPQAIGYHYAERSFASWLQNAREYGTVDAILARDQGRADVGRIVAEGFQRRPAPVRALTRACLSRPRVEALAQRLFSASYVTSDRFRAKRLVKLSLSGMYNLSYYRGFADHLGGPQAFDAAVDVHAGDRA